MFSFERLASKSWFDTLGCTYDLHLKEISKDKNRFLTDDPRKIKAQHLNKGKLHLPKYGSSVLGNNTVNEISKLLHWQIDRSILNASAEECNFKDDLTAKKILWVQHNTENYTQW